MTIPFLILAVLTVAGALAAVALRNLVHCALALIASFIGLAALFLNLNAEFIGLAQLLVYVGAIAILIVFVILLTRSVDAEWLPASPSASGVTGILVGAGVFAVLAYSISQGFPAHRPGTAPPVTSIREIGQALLDHYILPLEVIALMLTAALIGAVIIAMKEKKQPAEDAPAVKEGAAREEVNA